MGTEIFIQQSFGNTIQESEDVGMLTLLQNQMKVLMQHLQIVLFG